MSGFFDGICTRFGWYGFIESEQLKKPMNTKIKRLVNHVNIVGVIASSEDLKVALANPHIADMYEWRVDFYQSTTVEPGLRSLRKPIILTVRDPDEGGKEWGWTLGRRAALYEQYMRLATFVDVEACNAEAFARVIRKAKEAGVGVIISQHVFDKTPWSPELTESAAKICFDRKGDIFKTVLLPDGPVEFFQFMICASRLETKYFPMKIAPMAIGKQYGQASRVLAGRTGSPLVYGHLGNAKVEGQWHVSEIRDILEKARH